MADKKITTEEKQASKRRLRKAPTMREQAADKAKKVEKSNQPSRHVVIRAFFGGFFMPLRKLGRGIRWISKYIVPPYFRNSWQELRQVTWLSIRESRRYTTAVILFAIVFGVLIAIVDYGLDKAFKQILLR